MVGMSEKASSGTYAAPELPTKSGLSALNAIPTLNGNVSDPRVQQETKILKSCPVLTPTGCTPQFCQAGKRVRPLETQLGENRPISTIKLEAEAFLREVASEGNVFTNQEEVEARIEEVMREIDAAKEEGFVWEDRVEEIAFEEGARMMGSESLENLRQRRVQVKGMTSKGWTQRTEELQWGIRFAWRNARKCIMRAHFQQLRLCDLRHVKTSQGMIDAVMEHLPAVHNGGRIRPTVLVFPQRSTDETGPMFISKQLLNFAGYSLPNGEVLGDPANVQLTEDTIELGWKPPTPKTRWDILPVVAMAEGQEPAMGTLPPQITKLVHLRHPGFPGEFEKIDLRWYQFPALSRLGYDIGGVQYTATPFIGWWMDSEIGVRDLLDNDRYNAFPDVLKAIGWRNKGTEFEDLAEHDRLLWMSRAQAELNYAVQHSFLEEKVTCTSTLAASQSWSAFDDQHFEEKGYRLNSDPHWLSPPQGSIIPLWHRGGLPNYQPKPLIAKHRYDPVKVWRRKNNTVHKLHAQDTLNNKLNSLRIGNEGLVHVFHCGTGGNAQKLGERLQRCLQKKDPPVSLGQFGTLNSAKKDAIFMNDIVLVIIATTGQGEVPINGQKFFQNIQALKTQDFPCRYAIFGLGDGGYAKTFNAAGKSALQFFQDVKATQLGPKGLTMSDVSIENPPSTVFQSWWRMIEKALDGESDGIETAEEVDDSYLQQHFMLKSYKEAKLHFHEANRTIGRILRLGVEIEDAEYKEMDHIRLLPRTSPEMVQRVIKLLGLDARTTKVPIPPDGPHVPIKDFLADFVDCYMPFRTTGWLKDSQYSEDEASLADKSVVEVLEDNFKGREERRPTKEEDVLAILFSMPLLRPRCYSIASSPSPPQPSDTNNATPRPCVVDTIIRVIPSGRFSDVCLSDLPPEGRIPYKITSSTICEPLLKLTSKPLVVVACGTGFAPVRSMLQLRAKQVQAVQTPRAAKICCNEKAPLEHDVISKTMLFLGFKPEDQSIFVENVQEAAKHDVLDAVQLVPSNRAKLRVQDFFEVCAAGLRRRLVEERGWLYVCGADEMVKDVERKLEMLLGGKIWDDLKERVVKEIF